MNELMYYNDDVQISETTNTPIEVLLQVGEDGRVSARDTYSFLSPGQSDFARWARTNITDNGFAEYGADFTVTRIGAEYGNPLTGGVSKRVLQDYRLSVPFAKKLCMISKTERGEQAREYFIGVEKALQAVVTRLPQLTPNEMILQLAKANVELEKEVSEIREEVHLINGKFDSAMKSFAAPSLDHWKADMDTKINDLIVTYRRSPTGFRGMLYSELEHTANVRLKNRMTHLQNRMKKQGATYKERMAITKLDVISKDKQLRAIFEGIVKRQQAIYGVGDME